MMGESRSLENESIPLCVVRARIIRRLLYLPKKVIESAGIPENCEVTIVVKEKGRLEAIYDG